MVIDVSAIRRSRGQSLQISEDYTEPVEGLELRSPLKVSLKITNVGDGLLLAGTLSAVVSLVCSRCAGDYDERLDVQVSELYVPVGTPGTSGGDEREAGELCVFTYEDNVIDLHEVLRQNLLASLPFRPLCREDCRGLCAQCGANLNEEACKCEPVQELDSRWKALEKFRTGSPEESRRGAGK